jgi:clorobiocin biosynthesis protein CloN7
MIGSPMDSTGFVGLAHVLAGRYTVVTYDPRADQAMLKFMAHAGLGEAPGQEPGAPSWQPIPEQVATMRADAEVFLAFLFRPTTNYRPDIDTLRAAAPRIVVAVGETSKGPACPPHRPGSTDRLGTPVVEFPGDHVGFISQPGPFAQALYPLLRGP